MVGHRAPRIGRAIAFMTSYRGLKEGYPPSTVENTARLDCSGPALGVSTAGFFSLSRETVIGGGRWGCFIRQDIQRVSLQDMDLNLSSPKLVDLKPSEVALRTVGGGKGTFRSYGSFVVWSSRRARRLQGKDRSLHLS